MLCCGDSAALFVCAILFARELEGTRLEVVAGRCMLACSFDEALGLMIVCGLACGLRPGPTPAALEFMTGYFRGLPRGRFAGICDCNREAGSSVMTLTRCGEGAYSSLGVGEGRLG